MAVAGDLKNCCWMLFLIFFHSLKNIRHDEDVLFFVPPIIEPLEKFFFLLFFYVGDDNERLVVFLDKAGELIEMKLVVLPKQLIFFR